MPIATLDQYIAAPKQRVQFIKTGQVTAVAAQPFSVFNAIGQPVGVLAGGQTTPPANTVGAVPTDAIAGYPTIDAFGAGNLGYISNVQFFGSVAGRITLYDRLWVGGTYANNANVNVTTPSWASRVSLNGGAANYSNLELWVEQVTAATGNQAVNVTYTNQSGTPSRSTGAVGIGAAPTVGRMWRLPLAAGDSGLSAISNVTGSVASAGTFNVCVLRRLWSGRINSANFGENHDMLKTGLVEVFENSALFAVVTPDSTATPLIEMSIEIAYD